jgi:hypothetical protein
MEAQMHRMPLQHEGEMEELKQQHSEEVEVCMTLAIFMVLKERRHNRQLRHG